MKDIDFSVKNTECDFCGAWYKEHTKKCPRCFTGSETYIVDTWRNYKTKKSNDILGSTKNLPATHE